RLSSPLHFV
nr:Chain C, Reticulophagy regulator 2 [Homo sapiens]6EWC_G Chain G, Reticulophagy regulator 2 [Homo sapiens]